MFSPLSVMDSGEFFAHQPKLEFADELNYLIKYLVSTKIITTFAHESVRSCSRSAIDASIIALA